MNKQTNIAPFVRIVAVDGKAYPLAPGGVSGPSPDFEAPPTPQTPPMDRGGAGEASTPLGASPTYQAKPDCQQCGRGYWGCICGFPEPDVMPVSDMMRIMPELFDGSSWLRAEEAAVRK
jgi:hypothetical protein